MMSISRHQGQHQRVFEIVIFFALLSFSSLLGGGTNECPVNMVDPHLIAVDEISGVWTFLQSIDWHDPWLVGLILFHIIITLMTLLTRNHSNFQVLLFFTLLLLVYFSESINEIAASNWSLFSRQQYFDTKGMFISLVFSVPILLNCMIMVANWLWQSSQLMTKLKRAQLRQQAQFLRQQSRQQSAAEAKPKVE